MLVPVCGLGLQTLWVPQHKMVLSFEHFQGEVAVAVHPGLPLGGIEMISGNDIAGSRVWADPSALIPLLSSLQLPWLTVSLTRVRQSFSKVFAAM